MKSVIQTGDAPAAIGTYSQAVRCGDTVYLSGQIGLDPATMQLVEGIDAQIERVFAESAGGRRSRRASTRAMRCSVTVYLTDLAHFAQGQRDHGAVFQAAVPGARRRRRGQPAARRAGRGRRHPRLTRG